MDNSEVGNNSWREVFGDEVCNL